MTTTYTVATWIGLGDDALDATVTFDYYPGDLGQTSGPPERCREPTDDEIEITSVLVDGEERTLTEAESEALTDRLYDIAAARLCAENDDARDGLAADADLWRD